MAMEGKQVKGREVKKNSISVGIILLSLVSTSLLKFIPNIVFVPVFRVKVSMRDESHEFLSGYSPIKDFK